MSPRFVLGRESVPCVAEVVNRSLKADCTDFTLNKLKQTFVLGAVCHVRESGNLKRLCVLVDQNVSLFLFRGDSAQELFC